jgi:seryl-tRNA synthetase
MPVEPQQDVHPFLQQLFDHGLLIPSSVMGVYGRSGVFEDVIAGLDALFTTYRVSGTEIMRFPPILPREIIERSGYMKSFPQLLGSVHSFMGNYHQHKELLQNIELDHDWSHHLSSASIALTPASCYPVYAIVAGTLPAGGRLVDASSYCFRHEPSSDPARMLSFRQREYVCIAEEEIVKDWHADWLTRGQEFLCSLGIEFLLAPANDPFFGPGGRFLAASQKEQNLKFEFLAAIGTDKPIRAIMSVNHHQSHFAQMFGILTVDGEVAHTACAGFGMERVALALFHAHGFDVTQWSAEVRGRLWP